MAWHIANSKGEIKTKNNQSSKPFTFIQAASFQWVNPKAWFMAITVTVSFVTNPQIGFIQIMIIALIFMLCGFISTYTWTLGGVYLKKFIKTLYM